MLEPIIQHFIDKGKLHARAAYDARNFAAYLEEQSEYTRAQLEDVIKRFNYDTLPPNKHGSLPALEFWRGVDDFGSSLAVSYDGDGDILHDREPVVKRQYDHEKQISDAERIATMKKRSAIRIDVHKHAISLLGHFEYKFNSTALFYTWLALLWQEIEGHRCGLKVGTVQNNSIARFSLNDFLNDDFSAFMDNDAGDKTVRIEKFFPRKLSVVELFMRACQDGYPFNPYENYWRYFERGDEFIEIVTYDSATAVRSGRQTDYSTADVGPAKQHASSKAALMHLTDFTNQAIFTGWEEKFRPAGGPERMHDHAYDFDFWTGVSWSDEAKNRLNPNTLVAFEHRFGINLPDAFFHYLRLFNGRQYNNYHLCFPIDDLYTVTVKKFYTLDELTQSASANLSVSPEILWIGELESNENLGVYIKREDPDYGKVVTGHRDNFRVRNYSFEKFARYAQASPVQPEIFAAHENDAQFLKQRLAEGWDYSTVYRYQTAVDEAAEYNSHEALEVLLQAGARLRTKKHREITWLYDDHTMELLDKYV